MPEIKIYADAYKHEIATLILNIQKTEFGIPITLEDQPDLDAIPEFYQTNNGNFWVAIDDNKVVGTIALLDIGNRQGALRKMFVNKECRGSNFGIGQKLLSNLLEWAGRKNFDEILLGTTEKFVAAQRFYEKNGFIEIEKDTLPPAFPVMTVDVKFYKYTLV
jgi:N-acetylglutamate synthase-like GNAT family acetyltransferase